MTHSFKSSAILTIGLIGIGGLAHAQQPPDPIASDGYANTAPGSAALVSFHLKSDPKGAVQYGLIAEEVDKVYPQLVIRDDTGKIRGVRYDELAPVLLNEVQRQAAEIRALKRQQARYASEAELKDLRQQLQAALLKLQAKDELVAQR